MTSTDIGQILLRASRAVKPLSPGSEKALIVSYRDGDPAALGTLVIAHVRLATSQARQLQHYGVPVDDLIQEGMVGLLEAAARFDVTRDLRFSTYASWWIKGTTHEYVLRNWSIVRTAITGEQKTLFFNLRRMKARLMRDPSASPSSVRAAIAAALGMPVAEIEVMDARLGGGDVALNAPAGWDEDGEAEIGDRLVDTSPLQDDLLAEFFEDDQRGAELRRAMDALDERERLIVEERWMAEDVAPLGALGEWFGITAGTVRRIEIGAIVKLRMAMLPLLAAQASA